MAPKSGYRFSEKAMRKRESGLPAAHALPSVALKAEELHAF
jgi:hypothetical protein